MTRALIAKVTVQQEGHPSEQQGSVGEKEEQQQLDFAASSSGRGEVVLWVPVRAEENSEAHFFLSKNIA
jgi:hypothetical protein